MSQAFSPATHHYYCHGSMDVFASADGGVSYHVMTTAVTIQHCCYVCFWNDERIYIPYNCITSQVQPQIENQNSMNYIFFKFMNFYWILKMLTEFCFKIQYFNFDLMTLLHSHRNTQQWKVRLKSVLFRVRISNSPLFPFNGCFNIVRNLNVLQFNHKTYQ